MANYTITLTTNEEIALTYLTEQTNTRRANERDADGNPLPVLTKAQVLVVMARQDFLHAARNMDAELQQLLVPLRAITDAAQRQLAIDTLSPALKARLQVRLA